MLSHLNEQFEALRKRLEDEHHQASLILIASAKPDDGADLTAHGLAEALAASGHATALVDVRSHAAPQRAVDESRPDVREAAQILPHRRGAALAMIAYSGTDDPATAVPAFAATLRERYRYAVIDGAAIPQNEVAAILSSLADAVVLTVRNGRMSSREDEVLLSVLDRGRRPVLGVVTVDRKAIAAFTKHELHFTPSTEVVPLMRAVANV